MHARRAAVIASLGALVALGACLLPPPAAAGTNPPVPGAAPGAPALAPAEMPALVKDFAADERSVRSFFAIDVSDSRLERLDELAKQWRGRLDAVDFDALDQDGRIDWLLLGNHLASGLRERDARRRKLDESRELVPFAPEIIALEEARWHLQPVDPEQAAKELEALSKAVKSVRERVEKGVDQADKKAEPAADHDAAEAPAPEGEKAEAASDVAPLKTTPVLARRAAGEVDSLRAALESWFRHYDAFRPGFSWWTRQPYDAAHKELEDYAKLLRERVAKQKGEPDDPLVGDPIGRQALLDGIAAEMIAYSPEELLAIGEREFAWCETEMKKASAEMGSGEDWKAALEKVKADHVPPGEQDALVAAQAREAIAFLEEHDLVTIPPLCRETWRVRMIDEGTQKTLPYAAYGGQDMLVAYPTAAMDTDTKLMTMRGNNVHFSRIVVPHELIPGHHLQGYVADRAREHRQLFSTPFLVEGWALYWEMVLWDKGWARGAEDRVGMLFWRMHRAARIIVSLKFQLGQMQPQEMVDFLVQRVGHEKAGATSEVRRYIGGDYGPLYQCAYMIGGLQLRALRAELVDGGRMTDRQFHDAVLAQNAIPVALIRAALTGEKLTRDWRSDWRFAGPLGAAGAGAAPAGAGAQAPGAH